MDDDDVRNAMIDVMKLTMKQAYWTGLNGVDIHSDEDRLAIQANFMLAAYEAACELAGKSWTHQILQSLIARKPGT